MHYDVGQLITDVIEIETSSEDNGKRVRYWPKLLSVAACLCLVFLGAWQLFFFPYGVVRMRINPAVQMTVNRMGYVTDLEGLNHDGEKLLADISSFGKKLNGMADELADKAMHMGYLKEGGSITLLVSGRNQKWENTTETELRQELYSHLHEQVEILTITPSEGAIQPQPNSTPVVIPVDPVDDESDYGDDSGKTNDDGALLPAENTDDSAYEVLAPASGDSDYEVPTPTDGGSDYGAPASTDSDSDSGTPEPTDGDSDYDSGENGDSEYNE